MKAFFDDRQWDHNPKHFMANGAISPNPEQPERIAILKKGAVAAGCDFLRPDDAGLGPIAAIHSPQYLRFLQTIYQRWGHIKGGGAEVNPNVHPMNRTDSYTKYSVGQAGFHQADTACPIAEGTWSAAYWSAQSAIAGADTLIDGARAAYVLSRPPGHHAFADLAGGFCFLNNSAIAAERLRSRGFRPTILDVDVHHGNGTQGIFYSRHDVFTVSLHANPERFYPFFWGHSQEKGAGQGVGYNLNIPLERGTADEAYLQHLDLALKHVDDFGTDVLVVALGLDAFVDDPFKGLAISTQGFARIAKAIKALNRPTLLVQEGGYICDALADNLTSFLDVFTASP